VGIYVSGLIDIHRSWWQEEGRGKGRGRGRGDTIPI